MDSGRQKKIELNIINIKDIRELEEQVKERELLLQDINIEITMAEKTNDKNILKELFTRRCHIKLSIYFRIKMIQYIKSQLLIC